MNDEQPIAALRQAGEILRPALLLWLVVVALFGAYAQLMAYFAPRLPVGSWLLVCYELTYLAMAAVVGVFAWRDREACRVFARPRRGMVEMCLLAGIVGSMLLAMWERTVPGFSTALISVERAAGWPLWVCLLASAVLPAAFEEWMYRGVILQRLRAVVSLPMALAVQAMMFAVMHMDTTYVLPHFVFGCLAGFLRTAARALWPCMLMHGLWNGWVVLLHYEVL